MSQCRIKERFSNTTYFVTFECVQFNDESNVNSIVMNCVRGTSKYYESVQTQKRKRGSRASRSNTSARTPRTGSRIHKRTTR